jgi:hypothetical protein
MIKAFALTGRIAKCYLIPRVLPWARSFCPFRACCCIETFGDIFVTFEDIFISFGDIFIIFGDIFVTFGDIIPYPDYEADKSDEQAVSPRNLDME